MSKKRVSFACAQRLFVLLASLLILSSVPGQMSYAQGIKEDDESHPTGLIIMTPEEVDAFRKSHEKVEKVLPNKIAIGRVNKERIEKGLPPLSEEGAAPLGRENIISKGGGAPDTGGIVYQEYGTYGDNSILGAFPVIGNQGALGSCTTFATTYYQLTHTVGLLAGWNNKTSNEHTFSPKWTYNMVNQGENSGSSFVDNYDLLEEHGAATLPQWSYDADYKAWCLNGDTWKSAIQYRANPIQFMDIPVLPGGDVDLSNIKQAISNSYVLVFGTFISSWQYKKIGDDKSTPGVDPHVRESIAYWVNGTQGGHAMTIVGYDDTIWVDINNNRQTEDYEKGALKIANSWGASWMENGFVWLAYDALRNPSLAGGPSDPRVPAINNNMVFDMRVKHPYTPKRVARFTMSHAKRNQLRINLGVSDTSQSQPAITWYPGAISLQGGPYAFNGTNTECLGSFAFDFTDILIPPAGGNIKYYLGVYDSTDGNAATLSYFRVEDADGYGSDTAYNVPMSVDDEYGEAYIIHSCPEGVTNNPPIAIASADPYFGPAPLAVTFSAAGSSDPDVGDAITYYFWNFGDRRGAPGDPKNNGSVTYTYTTPGEYWAKLTVGDSHGASSCDIILIQVGGSSNHKMYVNNIGMAIINGAKTKYATATVTIMGKPVGGGNDIPISGAKVYGHWSGLTTDSDNGITNINGVVTLSSDSVSSKRSGTFTFCVDDVVHPSWGYDASINNETCDSIATP